MDERDSSQTIFLSGPAGLAKILDQNQEDAALWGAGEMNAMWKHQLQAPLDADLSSVSSSNLSALRRDPATKSLLEKSFENLLRSDKPPMPLLKTVKDFAKRTFKEAEDAQFKEIAAALYYATYAMGLIWHNQRLGGMKRRELAGGFDWALERTWLDEETKRLISQAKSLLKM
jgi:hypothetical protein